MPSSNYLISDGFCFQVFMWQIHTYYPLLFGLSSFIASPPQFLSSISLPPLLPPYNAPPLLPSINLPPSSRSCTFVLLYPLPCSSSVFSSPLPVNHYPYQYRPYHPCSPLPSCSFSTFLFSISQTHHHFSLLPTHFLLCRSTNAPLLDLSICINWGNFITC